MRRLRLMTLLDCVPINSLYFNCCFDSFARNMAGRFFRINAYLVVALFVLAWSGCQVMKKKEASTLRLHLEVTPDGTDKNGPVPVYRQNPVHVNVEHSPFLTEHSIAKASVVEVMGSFQIMIQYDRRGTWLLEQYSTANRGRRIAIMSQFGQVRWLAAP